MATTSPLARVKQEFGGKDKLVDKIVGLIDAGDESKDDLRKRLLGAANRDLIAAAAAQELGKGKDKDYVTKLSTFSSGKLVDMLNSAKKRSARKARKGSAAPKARATTGAAPKAAAKAKRAPAKKPAAK